MKSADKQPKRTGKGGTPTPEGWKPGQSGNPSGRPKGLRNRATVLKEFLEASLKTKNPITGKEEDLTVEQRMALSMIAQVLTKGNVQAYKELMDSVYGKQKEQVDVTTDGDKINQVHYYLPQNKLIKKPLG